MPNKNITKINTLTLPTKHDNFLLTTYKTNLESQPHMQYVIVLQTKKLPKIPIVRIHSACSFSEKFGSLLCDCNDQLETSLELISKKKGIVFYLDQEGRGHGLINKILEYKLQEDGYDTIEASLKLNLPIDNREYDVVVKILKSMNIKKIRLITNNPKKIEKLEKEGIVITERIIIKTKLNKHNIKYLKIKKEKLHHLINI